MNTSPYTHAKRWLSCINDYWDLWHGGIPLRKRPKRIQIASFKDMVGNEVTLDKMIYFPHKCYSNRDIIEYRVVVEYKNTPDRNYGVNFRSFADAKKSFLMKIDLLLSRRW